jgi:hypothetical protein
MQNMTRSKWFKAIAITLVLTFLALDISWANPDGFTSRCSNLAAPNIHQDAGVQGLAYKLEGSVNGTILSVAKYLLGGPLGNDRPLDLKYMAPVLAQELKALPNAAVDLSRVEKKEDGRVLIPYVAEDGKLYVAVAALKDSPAAGTLQGETIEELSETYKIVKIEADAASQTKALPRRPGIMKSIILAAALTGGVTATSISQITGAETHMGWL